MDGLTFYKLMRILKSMLFKSVLNTVSIKDGSVFLSFYKDRAYNFEYRAVPAPPVLMKADNILGESPGILSSIQGGVVQDISAFGYERTGYIEIFKRRPSGKLLSYKLILEPAGNYANFFVINSEDIILYSLSSRTIDSDRNIGTGGRFFLPKANKKYSLNRFEGAVSFNDLAGFYPVTAFYADEMLKTYSFEQVCEKIKDSLDNDDNFYINEKGKVIPFFIENGQKITWQELGSYFNVKDNKGSSDSAYRIKKFFSVKRDKYIELAGKLENELNAAEKYPQIYEEAVLIKNNLYKITGAGKYIFEQYSENGVKNIEYTVERDENIQEKADKLFKKSARLKKSVDLIRQRMQDAMQLALSAEEQLYYAETLSQEELSDFEKLIQEEGKNKSRKIDKNYVSNFLKYEGDGFIIYIGRNSSSNHELVFHFAQSDDLWFHARNVPSAHGILRLNGAKINDDLIEMTAKAVAYYSKYSTESVIDVDYTYKKYVTKPKNTPAGFVTYKNFKTITVKPYLYEDMKKLMLLKENNIKH